MTAETIITASRDDFPVALVNLGLIGVGVEVGTYKGEFAEQILAHWPGVLHLVDPYRHFNGWQDILNHDDAGFAFVRSQAETRLAPWIDRIRWHHMTSLDAAEQPWAQRLDFVYLDARHDYRSVADDLRAWWPAIKEGGVLAGHDYLDGTMHDTHFGVKTAVRDWIRRIGRDLSDVTVTDESEYPTWMIRKR